MEVVVERAVATALKLVDEKDTSGVRAWKTVHKEVCYPPRTTPPSDSIFVHSRFSLPSSNNELDGRELCQNAKRWGNKGLMARQAATPSWGLAAEVEAPHCLAHSPPRLVHFHFPSDSTCEF